MIKRSSPLHTATGGFPRASRPAATSHWASRRMIAPALRHIEIRPLTAADIAEIDKFEE